MEKGKVDIRWLETREPAAQIHLCVVSNKRVAPVCGFQARTTFQRTTVDNRNTCATCLQLDRSGCQLNFRMPNGAKVCVRERRAPK